MYKVWHLKGLVVVVCICLAIIGAVCIVAPMAVNGSAESQQQHTVYLTFDDGPSSVTDQVLDVLLEHNVTATFFVLGGTTDRALLRYQRMMDESHAIGIHSYTHEDWIYQDIGRFQEDFQKLEALIYENTSYLSHIYRMPGGSHTSKCSGEMLSEIKGYLVEREYTLFDWDIDPKDSTADTLTKEELFENVVVGVEERPNQDLVILMHDDGLRTSLPEALPMIIGYFQEHDYTFSTLYQGNEKGVQ